MANLYDLTGPMIESETDRLIALGCFAMRSGVRKAKMSDGTTVEIERTRQIRPLDAPAYDAPALQNISEEYDSIAVDGFPGSAERIEGLADYYRDNEEKLTRKGEVITPAKGSPSILTTEEESDRLVEIIPSWASIPEGKRTPFQQFMIELAAESIIDVQGMQKLIIEQLGS